MVHNRKNHYAKKKEEAGGGNTVHSYYKNQIFNITTFGRD